MTLYCTTFNPKDHRISLTSRGYTFTPEQEDEIFSALKKVEYTETKPFMFELEVTESSFEVKNKYEIQLSPEMYLIFLSDLLEKSYVTKEEVIANISIEALRSSFQSRVKNPFGNFIVFSESLTGARSGVLTTNLQDAQKHILNNTPFIFAVSVITPEILKVIEKASGFITTHVGLTSHASVIARGVGIPALFVNKDVTIANTCIRYNGMKIQAGITVTLDGNAKRLYFTKLDIVDTKAAIPDNILEILSTTDKVQLNTEKVDDIERGKLTNTANIGLLRLEHLVLQTKVLHSFRKYILQRYFSEKDQFSKRFASELQQELSKIFAAVGQNEVTVRLLDPPLHEFFELSKSDLSTYAKQLRILPKKIEAVLENLKENNPMMGLRGARLMLAFHKILELQLEVLLALHKEFPEVDLRVEIPFIMNATEGKVLISRVKEKLAGTAIKIGVMFEIPSLLYSIEELTKHVDFISFGTNDLTQFTFGLSRDDNTRIIHQFIDHKIFPNSPFEIIEFNSVGQILKEAVQKIRSISDTVDLLVCGEHAGNFESIQFFKSIGIEKFSCSIGRVTEAQFAVLKGI